MTDIPEDDFVAITRDFVRQKIVHTLTYYPRLSPSMLQVGIGTGISPKLWRIVFEDMIKEGKIRQEITQVRVPNGRDQTLKIISLVPENADSNPSNV